MKITAFISLICLITTGGIAAQNPGLVELGKLKSITEQVGASIQKEWVAKDSASRLIYKQARGYYRDVKAQQEGVVSALQIAIKTGGFRKTMKKNFEADIQKINDLSKKQVDHYNNNQEKFSINKGLTILPITLDPATIIDAINKAIREKRDFAAKSIEVLKIKDWDTLVSKQTN